MGGARRYTPRQPTLQSTGDSPTVCDAIRTTRELCHLRDLFQLCTASRDAYAVWMVSYLHELLLLLFRNRSDAAADLLRELDVDVPG
jgi:hypothetical protein